MQTRSVTSDDLLVISANDDAAGEPGDLIFRTSGAERGRIKSDGTVTGVFAGVAPVTMDVLFANQPPAAAVPFNAKKITGLANGTAATDAAAFGQIPVQLAPTAVKTANYNASAADFVLCNISGGSFTVTLPTAPADKTTIGFKTVVFGAGNKVTVAAGGSDVFNVAAGATSQVFGNGVNQAAIFQYIAATSVWLEIASDPSQSTEDLALRAAGLLGVSGDESTYTQSDPPPTQVVHAQLIGLRGGDTVTGVALSNAVPAAGTLPTTVRSGIADSTGKILALSGNANTLAIWAPGGNASKVLLPFTAPFVIPLSGAYFACFVVNGVWGTTQPGPMRGSGASAAGSAMPGFAPKTFALAGQTDLPAVNSSLTPITGSGRCYWMAFY